MSEDRWTWGRTMNCNIQHAVLESSFSPNIFHSYEFKYYYDLLPTIRARHPDTPKFKNIIRIPGAQFQIRQLVFAATRGKERGRERRRNSRAGIKCSHLAFYAGVSAIRENWESRGRCIGCTTRDGARGRGFSEHMSGELISSRR